MSGNVPADVCREFPEQPFVFGNSALAWSPDGRWIAASDGRLLVWDARTGRLVHTATSGPPEEFSVFAQLLFTPDSARLVTSTFDEQIIEFETSTWTELPRQELDPNLPNLDRIGFVGYSTDQQELIVLLGLGGLGGGWLYRLDAQSLDVVAGFEVHEGSPKAFALSADGSTVVTGASDGLLRVWELASGRLLHQVPFPSQIQGVAFADEDHVVVAPHTGHLFTITIDSAELLDTVARSLTRGFTPDECARFNFGDECPTLDELRGE